MLDVEAYGYDISEYAVENADPTVKQYISNARFDLPAYELIVAKDVLEHVPKEALPYTLGLITDLLCRDGTAFVVVPLGDDGVFRIREYELDITHVIKEDEEWWTEQFKGAGFTVEEFYYSYPGAKDHWQKVHPYGNGTFVLRRKV
jgi:hypothetical protein